MPPRPIAALLVTLALAACAGQQAPSRTASPVSPGSSTRPASASPTVAMPGRPYDADALLQAMRDSRRPGGVPEELQTEELAAAVAKQLWTYDGAPWPTLAIGGACGPASCTLEVAGTPAAAAGSDLYSFAIDPGAGSVRLETSDLHGYPAALEDVIDDAAQAAAGDELQGLALSGARWLPPPDTDQFWVAYRSGGEENSPGIDLRIALGLGRVLEMRPA